MKLSNLITAACATMGVGLSGMAMSAEIFTPDGYSNFGAPQSTTVDRPMDIVTKQLSAFPENALEVYGRLELKSYADRGDRIVVEIKETGFRDDSVDGALRKYLFQPLESGKFELVGYGYQQRCVRSENVDEWVSTPCP